MSSAIQCILLLNTYFTVTGKTNITFFVILELSSDITDMW